MMKMMILRMMMVTLPIFKLRVSISLDVMGRCVQLN